ncbi:MAG TPA: MarR family winged helix-turn-helix transcriptional regulator [Thermomicrobiales bacterium]|mgnify:CR=1 FL=1|jgi:DNA-binding MarR family transcriptional regulator|nr:transcriptional regulator [Chloroflexota bacterium]HQX63421.1 MarR family winged helix-turn-helix transcriptional regulator [Thermomicrobiales bacterium]HBY45398.1 transcriptional regulator [Chloroflexota bacterium]HCG30156.1 transcriptional regulator [Chloroflexota bacterium]HQZ90188.1 MarR family winged helix-turn-helix transcriptional regulator [Thermomicrobiales bacterium]
MPESSAIGTTAEQIHEMREQHIGRLLLRAQRAVNARAIARLHERGHHGLTLTHTSLLPYLDLEGTRITTLAERAGMTKQGMGQLVRDMERQGYVRRDVDPADARAVLVRFTDVGWQFLGDARAVRQEIEAEYADILGRDQLEALRKTLQVIIQMDDGGSQGE